ncbi:MAG: MAPEG family protein [Pseudomonadota bacterium]
MVTPLYAALLTGLFLVLSFRALLLRRKHGVGVGTGGNPTLEKALAAHSNCAEYLPLALLLLYMLEVQTGTGLTVHALGVALVIGRCLHAYGVSQVDEDYRFRVAGMVLTLSCLIGAAWRLAASTLG